MAWNVYSVVCYSEGTALPAPGAEGQVYDLTDATCSTPCLLKELSGIGMSAVVAGTYGLATFRADTAVPAAIWKSGNTFLAITSVDGQMEYYAQAVEAVQNAQLSASQSRDAAVAAQQAAENAAGGVVGGGGSGAGNAFVISWDGVTGTQPERVYPVGHALAGQAIPLPDEVFVTWAQSTFPLGVAVDGDWHDHDVIV